VSRNGNQCVQHHKETEQSYALAVRQGKAMKQNNTQNRVILSFEAAEDRNSYCIFSIVLVINYSTLDQLQGKFPEK
jgi:hypothetical protein